MNELQVFTNPEFGQVRTVTIEEEPWFVGKDVAVALGYESPRAAVSKKVDPEDKGVSEMETPSGKQQMTIINESGLYALIFGSKLESAKRFKHWVTHEVLPAIRKTGSYSIIPKARASGNWKSHKEDTVDWNDQKYAEVWRQGWADTVNRYLEAAERPERLDLRSYERQGLDVIPTVHMGPAVVQMERRGIQTNIGNLNRDIKAANQMLSAIRKTIRGLLDWVGELIQAEKELLKEEAASTDLGVLLNDYLNQRKAGRSDWSWSGQQKGDLKDLKNVARAVVYLQQHKISTLEQLNTVLSGVKQKVSQAHTGMRKAEKRMKDIAGIQSAVAVCQEQKPVHDKYLKIGWKKRQAAFAESHQEELKAYNKAYRYLKAQHVDLNVNLDALEAEYSKLQADHATFARQLEQIQAELKPLNEVRYWVGQVLGPEQVEVLDKAESKQSVVEQLHQSHEQTRKQDKTSQKEQKMEL